MFDSNHPILGSRHADVLTAEPGTEESKLALVEEIKNRARGIFASRNYPEAEILYDKAIQIKPDDAILYANRSAVRLNLNLTDAALEDANKALDLDPAYSKAYYRKGQAHNARKEHEAALRAFEKGIELDPGNKTFKDMAAKTKVLAEKAVKEAVAVAAAAEKEEAKTPAASSTTSTTTTTTTSAPSAAAKAPVKKKKASSSSKKASGEEDDDEEVKLKAEEMRGYKTLADGRKTTYFNNVLSEDAKRLIGDIAPKKIEVSATTTEAASAGAAATGEGATTTGSAWNYAGTFEERNMTEWAKGKLQELLSSVRYTLPKLGSELEVVKVKDLEGDASVTFVRGKKKYLFDFVFTLEWAMELDCGKATGSLKYPDVTPDNDDEYDTLLEVDQLTPPEARPLINMYVKSSSEGLQQVVREKLQEFMKEFQTF